MKTKRNTRWDGRLLVGFPLTFFVFLSFIITPEERCVTILKTAV